MISIYKGNTGPSLTSTISFNGVAADLSTSTVKFMMRPEGSTTNKVNATATIVAPATAGNVRYDWSASDTDTVGDYLFWWRVTSLAGAVQDTPEEPLRILDHAASQTDSALDFVEVGEVRESIRKTVADRATDPLIESLIPAASRAIMNYIDAEIWPPETGVTHRFPVWDNFIDLTPRVLRSVTAFTINPEVSAAVLTSDQYELLPYTDPDGVYKAIEISRRVPVISQRLIDFGHAWVDITGNWGYLTIPAPIKRAAVIAVQGWLERDLASMADVMSGYDAQPVMAPQVTATFALPPASRYLLDPYRNAIGAV